MLFWILFGGVLTIAFIVIRFSNPPVYKKGSSVTYDSAISAAKSLYKKRLSEGLDIASGPCLTNDLKPGWVVDIVHSPRTSEDNLAKNQCQAYLEGRATHFIELDLSGNLVQVR